MIKEEDLILGNLRLLDVDNYIMLPINTTVRLLITASDVIHS
jgi:cytochrome c oxidase subunit 2